MSDDPSLNDEIEREIRAYMAEVHSDEQFDHPLETVTIDLSMMEMLIVVLGLNRLVRDEYVPTLVKAKCALLVQRFMASIAEQKDVTFEEEN